jgi:hypothetical protein
VTDEEQLRALLRRVSAAWVNQDVDALTTEGGSLRGYGYRVRDARLPAPDPMAGRTTLAAAFQTYEYFRIVDEHVNVLVDGDAAIVWGFFTEEFQNTDQPPEVVRVRFSNAAVKRDGDWKFIWGHRDAQVFDDTGRYVRPAQPPREGATGSPLHRSVGDDPFVVGAAGGGDAFEVGVVVQHDEA